MTWNKALSPHRRQGFIHSKSSPSAISSSGVFSVLLHDSPATFATMRTIARFALAEPSHEGGVVPTLSLLKTDHFSVDT